MESRKLQLKDLSLEELRTFFEKRGQQKFRANQLFRRMYQGVQHISEITEFPASLRSEIDESCIIQAVKIRERQLSSDGTRKYLFETEGGFVVESVFMKYKYGNTACISSQAGCRMGCSFCASGIAGLERNLTPGEIVDQVVSMERDTGERIGHIVVMGTGEPFDNYDALMKAIGIFHEESGLNIGLRNITVSTCGLIDRINDFAADLPQVNLAVSLHAPSDELRRKLMPVAKSYSMAELMKTCRHYTEVTHRRITFEYALISGVNDSLEDASALVSLLKGMLCHVNLIPLNYVEEKEYRGSARKQAVRFSEILDAGGIPVTIRRELGSDISAACGQLRLTEASVCK